VCVCVYVCVYVQVSCQLAACIMNTTDELVTRISKATSPFDKIRIWACFGMTRVDTMFEQELK